MAHLERSVATLRVSGQDLQPDEITVLLGAAPTYSQTKGEKRVFASGRERIPSLGSWHLSARTTEPEDLDAQVAELLAQLTPDLAVWHELSQRYRIDLFCGWFMGETNEGVAISCRTLLALGERGIELGIDLYSPTPEEGVRFGHDSAIMDCDR
ncbi:hypothetical protein ASD78_08420 [Lysobacter sp. Root667]|nr:hypothetical protein ASD78_08420 [Lysobacter sp. Root667]